MRETRAGFTLVELVVSMTILAVGLSMAIVTLRRPARVLARDAVQAMVLETDLVRSRAVASGGSAVLRFETGAAGAGDDWWAFWWTTDSVPSTTPPDAHLVEPLGSRLVFGTGNAVTGPLGDTVDAAVPVPAAAIVCDAWHRCDLGGEPVTTVYVTDPSDGDVVRAMTITRTGAVRFWAYTPENGRWE